MLEYCLRQERAKYHKLKYGVEPANYATSPDELNEFNLELDENMNSEGQDSVNWKKACGHLGVFCNRGLNLLYSFVDHRGDNFCGITCKKLDTPTP